jgi:hypothetical protein
VELDDGGEGDGRVLVRLVPLVSLSLGLAGVPVALEEHLVEVHAVAV